MSRTIKQLLNSFVLVTFSGISSIYAQQTEVIKNHSIIFSAGSFVLSDDHLSLLSRKINSRGITWSYANSDRYQEKSLTAGYERGSNNLENVRVNKFLLEYKNVFSLIRNKNLHLNNYTGYSIKVNPLFTKSADQYSWTGSTSFSLYNSLTYLWSNNKVSFDISIPIVGFASRPDAKKEYKGSLNEMLYNTLSDPVFTSLHNHKELNISFQYRKTISNRLNILTGASYFNRNIFIKENHFKEKRYSLQVGLLYLIKMVNKN